MATEQQIKEEVRLYAVEWMVCQLASVLLTATGQGNVILSQMRQQAIAGARGKTFQSVDPAMSDLLSAELEAAVDRLLGMTKELVERKQA